MSHERPLRQLIAFTGFTVVLLAVSWRTVTDFVVWPVLSGGVVGLGVGLLHVYTRRGWRARVLYYLLFILPLLIGVAVLPDDEILLLGTTAFLFFTVSLLYEYLNNKIKY